MHLAARIPALALSASLAAASLLSFAAPASAAPGDPFDPARPTIFIAQGTPTQLSIATPDDAGNFSFTNEGAPAPVNYNGIAFNTADNFLYGFVTSNPSAEIPLGSLVRVGQSGSVTRVGTTTFPVGGTSFNVGALGPNGNIYATLTTDDTLVVVNPATGAQVGAPITLSTSLNDVGQVSDWTFSQGFLWGIGDGRRIVRVDPATGTVTSWVSTLAFDTGFAGAAWTYIDGTVGFSHNTTGNVTRLAIANPAAASPTFTLVSSKSGPANASNDGAASPGLPADLALTKTSSGFAAGATVTYTLTVTNRGRGFSTGWTLTDTVPDTLTSVAATSTAATCAVAGNRVTCTGGDLDPDASATVTVTAQVPAGFTGSVRNSAEVVGNEPDPVEANNTAAVTDRVAAEEPTPGTPAEPGDTDPEAALPNTGAPASGPDAVAITGAATLGLGLVGLALVAVRRRRQGA